MRLDGVRGGQDAGLYLPGGVQVSSPGLMQPAQGTENCPFDIISGGWYRNI